jgi:hypothetical protein
LGRFNAVDLPDVDGGHRIAVGAGATGGVDCCPIFTSTSAALCAIDEARRVRLAVVVSLIPDASASQHASADAAVNCALGAEAIRPHVEDLARLADTAVLCYPNAGLPEAMGAYRETPETMVEVLGDRGAGQHRRRCCGTLPCDRGGRRASAPRAVRDPLTTTGPRAERLEPNGSSASSASAPTWPVAEVAALVAGRPRGAVAVAAAVGPGLDVA